MTGVVSYPRCVFWENPITDLESQMTCIHPYEKMNNPKKDYWLGQCRARKIGLAFVPYPITKKTGTISSIGQECAADTNIFIISVLSQLLFQNH